MVFLYYRFSNEHLSLKNGKETYPHSSLQPIMALNIGIQAVATSETLLRQAAGAIDNIDKLQSAINILGTGANGLVLVGAVLSFIKVFLPDKKHEAIMNEFSKLHEKINLVRNDIKDLEVTVKWESAELSYSDCVSKIDEAMFFVCKHAESIKSYPFMVP